MILLVTYDLKQPGRNYTPIHEYLKKFAYCKGLESVWLLDTTTNPDVVRDALKKLVDENDVIFVVELAKHWAAFDYHCAEWLKKSERRW